MSSFFLFFFFFFFNDTATTEIYTLSLHDALPILPGERSLCAVCADRVERNLLAIGHRDRKSTRLNSSHSSISYAVFCLKKKKKKKKMKRKKKKKKIKNTKTNTNKNNKYRTLHTYI